jgi:hypothetical protein
MLVLCILPKERRKIEKEAGNKIQNDTSEKPSRDSLNKITKGRNATYIALKPASVMAAEMASAGWVDTTQADIEFKETSTAVVPAISFKTAVTLAVHPPQVIP